MNLDGTDHHEIPVVIPSTHQISTGPIAISGDGSKIIFPLGSIDYPGEYDLFTCNLDGSEVTKILEHPATIPVMQFPYHSLAAF